MDHAEVLERIEEAVASAGGLARLGADPSPEAAEVRAHVTSCPPCAAEWRAWSLVSLGLAAAAPDTLEPRPGLRDQVLAAAAARPRAAGPAASRAPAPATGRVGAGASRSATTSGTAAPPEGATRSGVTLGPRRSRATAAGPAATAAPSGPPFRWLLLGAAAAVALFVAGAALGGLLLGTPGSPGATPRTAVASPAAPRGDPGRVLAEAALILQSGDHRLASLETPEGDAGGVVLVSGGAGRLAVVSSVLPAPPEGTRYLCLLDRSGERTQVGYMRWEPTSGGGGLAYWAGDAEPADLGQSGDVFIVQLDEADAQPALIGEFLG